MMSKTKRKWLVAFEDWMGWDVSESFVKQMDIQLKSEFEKITRAPFLEDLFHFGIHDVEIEYVEHNECPYATLKGFLVLGNESIDVDIIWFDKFSKREININDTIENENVEFHWLYLDPENPTILAWRNRKHNMVDLRNKYCNQCNFPVFSYLTSISMESVLHMEMKSSHLIAEVENMFGSFYKNWNEEAETMRRGYIHNISVECKNDLKHFEVYVDIGSASQEVYGRLFRHINESGIQVEKILVQNL